MAQQAVQLFLTEEATHQATTAVMIILTEDQAAVHHQTEATITAAVHQRDHTLLALHALQTAVAA
jgi:hypothetical protein